MFTLGDSVKMKAKWSVLALYENEAAREVAMRFCDAIVQRFWPRCTITLNWAKWSELEERGGAEEAEKQAGEADLILIATSPKGVLSSHVSWWLELALRKRGDREGVMVGLPLPNTGLDSDATATQVYLRKLAHQHGMDYLTAVPNELPVFEPESEESYNSRATQMTTVLDTILRRPSNPPRLI